MEIRSAKDALCAAAKKLMSRVVPTIERRPDHDHFLLRVRTPLSPIRQMSSTERWVPPPGDFGLPTSAEP
jgi:hypothetical protein